MHDESKIAEILDDAVADWGNPFIWGGRADRDWETKLVTNDIDCETGRQVAKLAGRDCTITMRWTEAGEAV